MGRLSGSEIGGMGGLPSQSFPVDGVDGSFQRFDPPLARPRKVGLLGVPAPHQLVGVLYRPLLPRRVDILKVGESDHDSRRQTSGNLMVRNFWEKALGKLNAPNGRDSGEGEAFRFAERTMRSSENRRASVPCWRAVGFRPRRRASRFPVILHFVLRASP